MQIAFHLGYTWYRWSNKYDGLKNKRDESERSLLITYLTGYIVHVEENYFVFFCDSIHMEYIYWLGNPVISSFI